MDNDIDDESNSTGGTSVLRVAGLATLQQVPAGIFFKGLAVRAKTLLSINGRSARSGPAMPRYKRSCWD